MRIDGLPLGLAVVAGTLAALNPCGFALLPIYLSSLVIGDDAPSHARALGRALASSAAMTLGFAAVFAVFGLALTPVATTIQRHLPWFTVVVGLALLPVGGWLLAGRQLSATMPRSGSGPALRRSVASMAGFGMAYALVSLGCTIGPFLAIVVSAFRGDSALAGVTLLVAYTAGMGLVVSVAALAVATAGTAMIQRMRRLAPVVSRAGGAVAVLAGAYVAYYGWYDLRLQRGSDPADAVITAAATVQTRLVDTVARLGPTTLLVILAVLIAASILLGHRMRHTKTDPARESTQSQDNRHDPS